MIYVHQKCTVFLFHTLLIAVDSARKMFSNKIMNKLALITNSGYV